MNTPHDVASPRERAEALINPNRDPIHEALGPHKYQESEFEHGAGRCDKCGGGEFAAIHQPVVDQGKRAADSLEYIAGRLGNIDFWTAKQSQALERIAGEMEYRRRCGAFWRLYEWLRGFFYRYSYDHVSGPPAPESYLAGARAGYLIDHPEARQ